MPAVMLEQGTLDMLQPVSGICAFGGRTPALKDARRSREHAYRSAIDSYRVEILTSIHAG
jgi:hypothetical protein